MKTAGSVLSCGVLLVDEHDELFVAHATGNSWWDIPKGHAEPGEAPLEAAIRETIEETGVRLRGDVLTDLGEHAYRRGKRLHLFAAKVMRSAIDPRTCVCTSYFTHFSGRSLPEADRFEWIAFALVPTRCAKSMSALLQKISLPDLTKRLALSDAVG